MGRVKGGHGPRAPQIVTILAIHAYVHEGTDESIGFADSIQH